MTALLSPEHDVAALARNIRRLIDDPQQRDALGKAGREHILQYHDVKNEVQRLEDLYMRVIKG